MPKKSPYIIELSKSLTTIASSKSASLNLYYFLVFGSILSFYLATSMFYNFISLCTFFFFQDVNKLLKFVE